MHFTNGILIRVGTQGLLVALIWNGGRLLPAPKSSPAPDGSWSSETPHLYPARPGRRYPFFCGYKVPDEDGNLDTWNQSAHRILAEDDSAKNWFKFISMKKAGKYMKRRAISQDHAPPEWNMDQSFDEMFFDAVKDRYVNNLDHAVAKTILGAE